MFDFEVLNSLRKILFGTFQYIEISPSKRYSNKLLLSGMLFVIGDDGIKVTNGISKSSQWFDTNTKIIKAFHVLKPKNEAFFMYFSQYSTVHQHSVF